MNHEAFPEIDLFPRITKVARFIGHLVTGPHQLASHGDNFYNHIAPFEDGGEALPEQLSLWAGVEE